MKKCMAAAFAMLMCSASAMANLAGTNMNLTITHDQFTALSGLNNATYTYASPSLFTVPNWGDIAVTSPAPAPGMMNALNVDFTLFSYAAFVAPFPATGTIKVTDLAEGFDLSSVKILVNGLDVAIGAMNSGNGFQASWSAPMVFSGNPAQPNLTLAWNSTVPAPGAFALLGIAGLVARPRRRRA